MRRHHLLVFLTLLLCAGCFLGMPKDRVLVFEDFDHGAQVGEGVLRYGSTAQWEIVEYPEGSGNYCLRPKDHNQHLGLALDLPVKPKKGRQIVVTLKYAAVAPDLTGSYHADIYLALMNTQYGYGVRHHVFYSGADRVMFFRANGAWHTRVDFNDSSTNIPEYIQPEWRRVKLVWEYDTISFYLEDELIASITDDTHVDETIDRLNLWYWKSGTTNVEAIYFDDIQVQMINRI